MKKILCLFGTTLFVGGFGLVIEKKECEAAAGGPLTFAAPRTPFCNSALDEPSQLTVESFERLKGIGFGQSEFQPTREDVPLVLRALNEKETSVSNHACLAVEKMALHKLFNRDDMKVLWEGLRPKLRSENEDTSEWSVRGASALCRDSELLSDAILDEAFDETSLMLSDNNAEMQRRGAFLSGSLVKRLSKDKCEKLVRKLLDSPSANQQDLNGTVDNPENNARWIVTPALVSSASKVETESLANEMAIRLLSTNDRPTHLSEAGRWEGLAHLADNTNQETRERIVKSIFAAVADKSLAYMNTSGVTSPSKHYGADGLAILSSFLTLEEIEVAEKAIPPEPTGETKTIQDSADQFASMYGVAKSALTTRKLELQQKLKPAMRVEEDLAFFEKIYKTKITEVRPKNEYSDPDQFYAAIAKELGISEIAWRAAAEKHGWKKDDGKNTFTMLKGGPTTEGGQGTWDVMFIRSTINPKTKKPNPDTLERVMVQIDYDGKITFPTIPNVNR